MNLKDQFKRIGGNRLNEDDLPMDKMGMSNVDHTTMKLKSNIDKKWRSVEDMKSDLLQWIQASVAASGVEMLEDIEEEYDSIGEEILKLYKSMDFPRSYR
tara:strand:+ start:3172 stop:3471 length:300 start_codon:yes stop_codon:yes gene_type:complete